MSTQKLSQRDFKGIELNLKTVQEILTLAYKLTGNEQAAHDIMFRASLHITDYNSIHDCKEQEAEKKRAFSHVLSLAMEYNK